MTMPLPDALRGLALAGGVLLLGCACSSEPDPAFAATMRRAIAGMRDYLPAHPASQAPDALEAACLQSGRSSAGRATDLGDCLAGIAGRYGTNFTLKALQLPAAAGSEGSVGMLVEDDADGFVVAGVVLGQAAAQAGVRSRERIVGLDGEDVSGLATTADLVQRIRGPVGTQVKLELANWAGNSRELVLTRALPAGERMAFAVSESEPGVCVPTPRDRIFFDTPRDLGAWKAARLMIFSSGEGVGACDVTGKVVIEPRFREIVPNGATALVSEGGDRTGIIRPDGTWLRAPDETHEYRVWREAKRYVRVGTEITVLDENGVPRTGERFDSIEPRDAYAIVGTRDGPDRLIDADGKVLLEAGENETLEWFDYHDDSGLSAYPLWIDRVVRRPDEDTRHGLFDVKSRRTIIAPRHLAISYSEAFDVFAVVGADGREGLHDAGGRVLIPPRYESIALPARDEQLRPAQPRPLDIVVVTRDGKESLYSIARQAEIGPCYDGIRIGRRGVGELRALLAQENGKWGVIGLDGKTIVDFAFEDPEDDIDAFGYIAMSRAPGAPRERLLAVPPDVASGIALRLAALRAAPPRQVADGAPLLGLGRPKSDFSTRYVPVVFASDEGVKTAYAQGKLFEPSMPSLLVTGDEAYSGLGNIRDVGKPTMSNVGPLCRTATGFEFLYRGAGSDEDLAKACGSDAPRLTFTRHAQGWRCENCGAFGIPPDWIEQPVR